MHRLKELRSKLNISQDELSKMLGITRSGVSDIETGRRAFTNKHIAILKSYGISEEWLRTGEGEIKAPKEREEEIADIVSTLYKEDNSFRFNLIKLLSELTDEQMSLVENMARRLIAETDKPKE